jgi:AraC-like DNA-binding protein
MLRQKTTLHLLLSSNSQDHSIAALFGSRNIPMNIPFDFPTIIHLAATILGIVSGLVILYQSIKTNPINMPLAIGQISLSLAIWVSFAVVSKLLVHWPFLFRTGSFLGLVFVPLPFLYVSFYTQKRTWRWYDFLHFIPAMVFLVDFWPIFILSSQQKLALILKDINDQNLYAELRESRFFPPGFHQTFRTILFSGYWVAQVGMVYQWVKKQVNFSYEDRVWKNWIMVYLFFQAGIWLPLYLTFIWIDRALTYHMVNTAAAAWMVVSSFLLLLYPSLLYGYQPIKSKQKSRKPQPTANVAFNAMDPELQKLEELKSLVDQRLAQDTLFLKPGYPITEFSKDIGIPVYQLSKCITQFSGMGFIDFMNEKRIQYCVKKLESGEWKNFTVEAIASECGFNNRNSFTNAFKKFKGTSPSEFKKQIGNTSALH